MIGRFARVTATVVLACAAVIGTSTTTAIAQGRGGGGGGMMGMGGGGGMDARVNSEDIDKLGKMLDLAGEQKDAAKMLFEGYLESHQKKSKDMRDVQEKAREDFRESRDPSVFQEMGEKMAKFREETMAAEKGLWSDVKSILTAEQSQMWPTFERSRRREAAATGFTPFQVSGERADVIKILDRIDISAETKTQLEPVLTAYEEELDVALVKRNDLQEKSEGQGRNLFRGFGGGGMDEESMTKIEKLVEENRESMMRVRDVHKRYASQVEGLLPTEQAEKFKYEFKRASYPQIYRERYTTRMIDSVEKFEDLSAEQKSSLIAIKETYANESAALAKRGEAAQDEQEKNFSFRKMMEGGMFGGGQGNDTMRELGEQRRALEDSTYNKVKSTLTPEQVSKLPERPANGGDGGGGGGNRRAGGAAGGQGGGNDANGGGAGAGGQRRARPQGQPEPK